MNPRIGIGLGHLNELALHFLNGVLLQVGQHEEQRVGHRGQGRVLRRPRASARTGWPIKGVVCHRGQNRVVDMRQECRECWLGQSGHGPYTPDALDHLFIAWHTSLRHSVMRR